jgi:hypothetical protein
MPDLQSMLEETSQGRGDFSTEILDAIKRFPHIVLRGAGNFGREIGELLLDEGCAKEKMVYWDERADLLRNIEGIPVLLPFRQRFDPRHALVIHCIMTMLPNDDKNYALHGYSHHIHGISLRIAFTCPLGLGTGRALSLCKKSQDCILCRCLKALGSGHAFIPNQGENEGEFIVDRITFDITQKCTLQCRHCIQYINHYPSVERIHFSLHRIQRDIDLLLDAHDFVRVLRLVGGETFLHPDVSEIIGYILGKKNFGILEIVTNGVCKISQDALKAMANERCWVRFSDYRENLNDKQRSLFERNIEKIARQGIRYSFFKFEWFTPSALKKMKYTQEHMEGMKQNCISHKLCRQAANGVYYPCEFARGVGQHHIADYETDRVRLDEGSVEELRARIIACNQRTFYQSCAHCDFSGTPVVPGEQGIDARYLHIGQK